MATHLGSEGTVKIGSNAVAEIVEWSLDESANIIGDSAQSDAWETNKAGRKKWSGTIKCMWDETDTTGQGAMTNGAEVTLNLYPEGAASSDTYFTGSVLISGRKVNSPDEGVITAEFSFVGNGAMSETTV